MIGPVYFITDPGAKLSVAEQARAAARGGAWAVQVRDKTGSDDDILRLVEGLLPEMAALGVRLFVNDRVDVACATGADLHIGQGDGDPRIARNRIGPNAILGLSVETAAQCAAIPDCVDYIGAGPFRSTATKPDAAAPTGPGGLAQIVSASPVPTIAIGGLSAADIPALRGAGAVGMAVVSAISRAEDPVLATRTLVTGWRST
ncbi:thiamine phosphate synthase [Jannaschia sp. 2305UL9-9]|uniref:thiamine phosphate synthase n=1 Tax=Jannaschia sp. 2305UL9-9 TaxID=3121638 RepID=UPI003527935F